MRVKIKRNIKEGPKEITPFKLSNTQDKIAKQIEEFYAKKKRYSGIEEIVEWDGYELRKIVGKYDKTYRWFLYDNGEPKLFVQFSGFGDPQSSEYGLQINNIRKTKGGEGEFKASDFYKFLMKQTDINPNGILYSDTQQTPGGKEIWDRLRADSKRADSKIEVEDLGKVLRAKFKAEDTFSSKAFKSKEHKRQSQIINLVHQRVRAAHKNAKDPDTKKRLKRALDYAEKRKESSKKKTERMRKKK